MGSRIVPGYFIFKDFAPDMDIGGDFLEATKLVPSAGAPEASAPAVIVGPDEFFAEQHVRRLPENPLRVSRLHKTYPQSALVRDLAKNIKDYVEDKRNDVGIDRIGRTYELINIVSDLHLYPDYPELIDQIKLFLLYKHNFLNDRSPNPTKLNVFFSFMTYLGVAATAGFITRQEVLEIVLLGLSKESLLVNQSVLMVKKSEADYGEGERVLIRKCDAVHFPYFFNLAISIRGFEIIPNLIAMKDGYQRLMTGSLRRDIFVQSRANQHQWNQMDVYTDEYGSIISDFDHAITQLKQLQAAEKTEA